MPVRVLDWRWAVDERTNRTQAGVALATARAPGSAIDTGVTVYGVVIRNQLHGLECSDNAGATWSSATLQTIIPEADLDKTSFNQRYNHRWPHGLTREQAVVEPDVGLTGSRFVCPRTHLQSGQRHHHQGGGRLSVRHRNHRWRIDDIDIHRAGFPILSEGDPLPHEQSNGDGRGGGGGGGGGGADITVCVQYVYGSGYSRRAILEHAAWYLLLGARRIVTFDSLEPALEASGERRRAAQESMATLQQTARALGSRFIVVRGMATWDVMRRTRLHMSGQSLAGTLCRNAAGSLVSLGSGSARSGAGPHLRGAGAAYVLLPDLDEFISPPVSDAFMPRRLGTQLSGALRRLVKRVDSGLPATGLYLDDHAAIGSRVYQGSGALRCLSFASAYYYLPTCSEVSSRLTSSALPTMTSRAQLLPTIFRRSWRGQPDNFEDGPSHNWTAFPRWNFWVRSKYLVGAAPGDDALMTGNHECCCRMAAQVGQQCTRRFGGVGNHTCSTLEFMPLEHWHIRHFKGLEGDERGAAGTAMPCRKSSWVASVQAMHGVRRKVTIQPQEAPFPESWAAEYTKMLSNLTYLVDAVPPSQ